MPTAAVDLDGTADSAPQVFGAIMRGLRSQGWTVEILTGTTPDQSIPVDSDGLALKIAKLKTLGLDDCYDAITLLGGNPKELAKAKAAWCAEHDVAIFIDNRRLNVKQATKAGVPLALLVWATRE